MNTCHVCNNIIAISVDPNLYLCRICNIEYLLFPKYIQNDIFIHYKIIYKVDDSIYEWIYPNVFWINKKPTDHISFGNINNKEDIIKFKKYVDSIAFI